MDDISEVVWDSTLEGVLLKAEDRAASSIAWLEDNGMVMAPSKSKLLVMGIKVLLKSKFWPARDNH